MGAGNTITATVTNGSDTGDAYTITVTRAARPTGCEADDIWCTEMTVGAVTGFGGYCRPAADTCGSTNTGTLDDDDFVLAGTTHKILNAGWRTLSGTLFSGAQFFEMSSVPAMDAHLGWTLHIGNRSARSGQL